jgi:hypothetical protein
MAKDQPPEVSKVGLNEHGIFQAISLLPTLPKPGKPARFQEFAPGEGLKSVLPGKKARFWIMKLINPNQ